MRKAVSGLPVADVVLAVALTATRFALLVTGIQSGTWMSYVVSPLLTMPLAWRRGRPLAGTAVVMGAVVVEIAVGGYHDSVVALAVYILIPYSLAAHAGSGWRMAAGMGLVVASGAFAQAAQPAPAALSGWASVVLGDTALLLVPFFAGLVMRQQRLRAETLERIAVQLDREREERARTAVAEERTRIARELHDELAHAMSVIAVQADAAEGALSHDPALVERPLVAIRETARDALGDLRRMLGALHGDETVRAAPEPGLARTGALVEQAKATGLEVQFRVEGEPTPLPPPVDLAAYRVLQEGLTNVRKHADARRADVILCFGRQVIEVEVIDDGRGMGTLGGTGRGLVGLRERVALLGGEFEAGPRAGGFALHVTLPVA